MVIVIIVIIVIGRGPQDITGYWMVPSHVHGLALFGQKLTNWPKGEGVPIVGQTRWSKFDQPHSYSEWVHIMPPQTHQVFVPYRFIPLPNERQPLRHRSLEFPGERYLACITPRRGEQDLSSPPNTLTNPLPQAALSQQNGVCVP